METIDSMDRAIVAHIPVLIKAYPEDSYGRRIVEVEASTEEVDYDGDVVLQSALMGSADSFVANGHLDIDHLSEIGVRLGIKDPTSFIVGKPLEVRAEKGGRTFVRGQIAKSIDGNFDPSHNKFDEFWASLRRDPPVQWFSSIYGYPTDLDDCTSKGKCSNGATRYVIKSIDWRSLAFTRSPKNTALSSPTRILSAKSYMAELAKSFAKADMPPQSPLPGDMQTVWANHACGKCEVHKSPSLLGYRYHFEKCMGYQEGHADIMAHATMHKTMLNNLFSTPL